MVTDETDIAESLSILFGTVAGERLMQPEWGVSPRELLFEPVSTTLRTLLLDQVRTALLVHEARIKVLDLRIVMTEEPGSGTLAIELDYEVRSTKCAFQSRVPLLLNHANELRAVVTPLVCAVPLANGGARDRPEHDRGAGPGPGRPRLASAPPAERPAGTSGRGALAGAGADHC